MTPRRDGRTPLWGGPLGMPMLTFNPLQCVQHTFFHSYSADPLSNVSGMMVFDNKEEAIAFAVKNGMYFSNTTKILGMYYIRLASNYLAQEIIKSSGEQGI